MSAILALRFIRGISMARLRLLGALAALGLLGEAAAVSLSTTGTGQVLIYPYYSARNLDTVVSMTNETGNPKAVKVSLREAQAGEAVLFFNVYLPAGDTWSALISSEDGRAFISTSDRTCTVPSLFAQRDDTLPLGEPRVFLRTGNVSSDAEANDRSREGFVEMIELGELTDGGAFLTNVGACNALTGAWVDGGFWSINPSLAMAPPAGGLSGEAQLVDPVEGISYRYQAVALENFSDRQLNSFPGFEAPTLADANGGQTPGKVLGTVTTAKGSIEVLWDTGIEAVSAALASASLVASVAVDSVADAESEVVLTLPTRRFFTDSDAAPPGVTLPLAPFDQDLLNVPYQIADASGSLLADCNSNALELPFAVQTLSLAPSLVASRYAVLGSQPVDESGIVTLALGQSSKLACEGGYRFAAARIASGNDRGRLAEVSGLPVVGIRLQRIGAQQLSTAAGRLTLAPAGSAGALSTEAQLSVQQ